CSTASSSATRGGASRCRSAATCCRPKRHASATGSWKARMTTRRIVPGLVLVALLSAIQAAALPRYSARYEQNCALCHVNPSGGGMRSAYAAQELVPKEFAIGRSPTPMIDTHLGKYVSIGTDFREIFIASTPIAGAISPQGFFPMQADVYLTLQLDPKYLL